MTTTWLHPTPEMPFVMVCVECGRGELSINDTSTPAFCLGCQQDTEWRPSTTFRCEACDAIIEGGVAVASHENRRHDSAQTCWPTAQVTA